MKTSNWFIRFKVYHIFFWIVYHYVWTVVNSGATPLDTFNIIYTSPKFAFYVVFQAAAVYFNLYFLIPRYLVNGRYVVYLTLLALTVVAASSIIASSYFLSNYNNSLWHFFKTYSLPSTLTSMFLAMSIKLTKNWIQSRRREEILEKEKLETELKFLRSQLNPHFLFNTINSIFVLIHKNPDMASEALAKFSDLLRYQLYEGNENKIPLEQELEYLEGYIELERLRLDSSVELKVNIERSNNDLNIAPFLLIPFIENAFKHVSSSKGWINVRLSLRNNHLVLDVSNNVDLTNNSKEIIKSNGIGLQNIRRRLDLIYPNEHTLDISQRDGRFEVKLSVAFV